MEPSTYTAFAGSRRLASGPLEQTIRRAKTYLDRGGSDALLVFEDRTGIQVDFDWRGTPDEVVARLARHPHVAPAEAPPERRPGPGRPRLGVVGREVSLLPRHWAWLTEQPGGASAALRRLVDEARKRERDGGAARHALEATSRFMSAMAGNLRDFEEASRALFARDGARLARLVAPWPKDVRRHVLELASPALATPGERTA